MKKLAIIISVFLTAIYTNAQNDTGKVEISIGKQKVLIVDDNGSKTTINIMPGTDIKKLMNDMFNVADSVVDLTIESFENKDTVEIEKNSKTNKETNKTDTVEMGFGKYKFVIIDNQDKSTFKIYQDKDSTNMENRKEDLENKNKQIKTIFDSKTCKNDKNSKTIKIQKENKEYFEPNWAGIESGINLLYNENTLFDMPSPYENMNLNYGKSWYFSFNFFNYGIGLYKDNIGLVAGLGLEFRNYVFLKSNITLPNPDTAFGILDTSNFSFIKSKLQTTHLKLPLFLEINLPEKSNFHILLGVTGNLMIGAHTKIKYYTKDGTLLKDKVKIKNNNISFLNLLNYSFTIGIGFEDISVYIDYSMMTLFKKNRGPQVLPVNIGINWSFF